ncbi:MAG: cytochrome c oxidase assembly protein [Candidatus Binatia bacterium]
MNDLLLLESTSKRARKKEIVSALIAILLGLLGFSVDPAWAHLSTDASFTDWHWRPDVLLVTVFFGTIYTVGWKLLHKRSAHVAYKWQLTLYLTGLLTISLALLSPIDSLASRLFLMHMIQHELLTLIAPPLLLLGNPLAPVLWGLPGSLRRALGRLLTRGAVVRRSLRAMTLMPVSLPLYVITLWGWHYPAAFEASLRNDLIHDMQHLSIFIAALLFWWPIINPAPRIHGHIPYGFRIVYVLVAAFQNTALGFLIAVTDRTLYPYYTVVPRLWGLSPLDDQAFGGAIMSEGGMMLIIPLLVLVKRMLDYEEQMTRQVESIRFRLKSARK